jgi:hypothetical protein
MMLLMRKLPVTLSNSIIVQKHLWSSFKYYTQFWKQDIKNTFPCYGPVWKGGECYVSWKHDVYQSLKASKMVDSTDSDNTHYCRPKEKILILLTYMCLFYVLLYNYIVIRALIISLHGTLSALAPAFK